MRQHWRRLWDSIRGSYNPEHKLWPEDRQSKYKGYAGELTHSITNVWIEGLRGAGVYDRKNKNGQGYFPWLGR